MEKIKLYTKSAVDENNVSYRLEYFLEIRSAEPGNIYGLEVVKKDEVDNVEKELVSGFSDSREEAELFLCRLAEGDVFPVELVALCDDYQTEKEKTTSENLVKANAINLNGYVEGVHFVNSPEAIKEVLL